MLRDRENLAEKEARIGLLMNNLDDKDSKLRQLLATIKDQQEQWERSIARLQHREDLVVLHNYIINNIVIFIFVLLPIVILSNELVL